MKIQLSGISKQFGGITALDDISLTIDAGQILAVVGVNGAGKSTLLRCLAGIIAPQKGQIIYDGQKFERGRLDLRKRLFFLPDFPVMYYHQSTLRHIAMVLQLYGADGDGAERRVLELLEEFDLLPFCDGPVGKLSRGQLYKAGLIALLALDPELWLLDEPFASGMDPLGIGAFKKRARAAAQRGRTVIYTTQILDIAENFSDRVCLLHHGKVRAFDAVTNLREQTSGNGGVLEELFQQLRGADK